VTPARLSRLLVGAVTLAGAACADGALQLNALLGVYALETAAGQPLPAVVLDTIIPDPARDLQVKVVVTAGSLDVKPDGTYEHRVERQLLVFDTPEPITAWVDGGAFATTDGGLRFVSNLIQNMSFTAVAANGTLVIEQDLSEEGQTAVYVYRK